MQTSYQASYLQCIRTTLDVALCIRGFPSQKVERHNVPEVEYGKSKELVLQPIFITRGEREACLIEPSVNSVRISFRLKKSDDIEASLVQNVARFLGKRAEIFRVLRRKPIEDWDISFLITNRSLLTLDKHQVIDFIITFMEDIDKDISSMKISINARARKIATSFLEATTG